MSQLEFLLNGDEKYSHHMRLGGFGMARHHTWPWNAFGNVAVLT